MTSYEHFCASQLKLPADYTRCHGIGCTLRMTCARHISPVPENRLVSWASNLNHDRAHICGYLIPVDND